MANNTGSREAKAVRKGTEGALASVSPCQNSPEGHGEQKTLSDKELRPTRQLTTNYTVEADPIAAESARMLASPDLPRQIIDDVHSLGVVGEDDLILMLYVTATARLMPRAIHLCVYGGFSSGKSIAAGKVLDLFPPDDVYRATQITRPSRRKIHAKYTSTFHGTPTAMAYPSL